MVSTFDIEDLTRVHRCSCHNKLRHLYNVIFIKQVVQHCSIPNTTSDHFNDNFAIFSHKNGNVDVFIVFSDDLYFH